MIDDEVIKQIVPKEFSYLLTEFLRVRIDDMDMDPVSDHIGTLVRDNNGDSAVIPHGLFKSMMILFMAHIGHADSSLDAETIKMAREFMTKMFIADIEQFLHICHDEGRKIDDALN